MKLDLAHRFSALIITIHCLLFQQNTCSGATGTISETSFIRQPALIVGEQPYNFLLVDLDLDGRQDLVVANHKSDHLTLYKNTTVEESITFELQATINTGHYPNRMALGDLDGDGMLDIALECFGDYAQRNGSLDILLNKSTNGVFTLNRINIPGFFNPLGVAIGDFDDDGKNDIAIANSGDKELLILKNDFSGGELSVTNFTRVFNRALGNDAREMKVADLDIDGKPDICVVVGVDEKITLLRNISTNGTMAFESNVDLFTGNYTGTLAVTDLDADGKPEIVVGNNLVEPGSNGLIVFKNAARPGILEATNFSIAAEYIPNHPVSVVATGDINGDGWTDLVTMVRATTSVVVLEHTGLVPASPQSYYDPIHLQIPEPTVYLYNSAVSDLNSDGRPDIIAMWDQNTGYASIYQNVATNFAQPPPLILSISTNVTTVSGKDVALVVEAEHELPLTYQWKLNSIPIPDATNSTLVITNVTTDRAGVYTVFVSTGLTGVSRSVTLSVAGLQFYAGLMIHGKINGNYLIEYATEIAEPVSWATLTNLTLATNPYLFIDIESPSHPERYYRATLQP